MGELIQFIFGLEDPVGRNIVWIILALFVFGGLNYLWHTVVRLPREWWNLHQAKTYFQKKPEIGDISDLLKNLRAAKVWPQSIIYRRIADFIHIKQSGGYIDNDALADILTGQESSKASLASHTLGILIILGLVGTLWGLIKALIEVQPLLTGIQDFEQLPEISRTLKSTVSSMSTAFATTLAGLGTSLLLGILGWGFNRVQSAFLTRLEAHVSTVLMPQFMQTTDPSIESAVQDLSACTKMLEFATQENVRVMQQAIQQLTDTSWDGQLEQHYILANKFGETAESLFSAYQKLIQSTSKSFEQLITESMSQIREYQETLLQGLEDSVPKLEEESKGLITAIEEYQRSQSKFIDDLSSTLQRQLQSITENQQGMVNVLTQLADELQIRSMLEAQNQVFERIESRLTENQQEVIRTFTQLVDEFQVRLHSGLEAQNEAFKGIESRLTENQQEVIRTFTQLVDETQVRLHSGLEAQNEAFKGIESRLTENQQEVIRTFTQLVDEFQVRFRSGLEAQNQVFERIESRLAENQQEVIRTFTQLVDETQVRLRSGLEAQNEAFKGIESRLTENQQETIDALMQLTDELQVRSVLEGQNQVFERIETQLIGNQQQIFDILTQLAGELQIRSTLVAQNQVFERIESHLSGYGDHATEQRKLMQMLITNVQQLSQVPPVEIKPTPGGDSSHQISSQLLNQISLKFDLLNEKIDALNNTVRQPSIYRWTSEIRRWFKGSR